jgi:hypothetical protein
MAWGSFQFSGREVHDVRLFLRNSAEEDARWKSIGEVKNERRSERFGLPSRPSEIIKYPAGKRIRLQRECSFIRQLFQNSFKSIIGLPTCQENFDQIKIFLILPKGIFGG